MENSKNELSSRLWQVVMTRGVILLIVGLILLLFPGATLTTLIFIMGVFWLIDGIITAYKSYREREAYPEWKWGLITGIVGIIAGLVVIFQPSLSSVITTSFLIWFLGLAVIFYGLSGLILGIRLHKENDSQWNMIIGGAFSILIGILLISSPYVAALTIIKTIGIVAIIAGIIVIAVALKIKKRAS